jgi:hypothetical protein
VARFCKIWQEFLWWRDFGGHFAWIALKIKSSWLPCLIEEFTRPVNTQQKTFSPYGDSDEESDCSPPTPTNIKANEKKIDESLRNFIEALLHLETLHYGFKYQASGRNGYCFCAFATCLSSWRKKYHVDNDFSRSFSSNSGDTTLEYNMICQCKWPSSCGSITPLKAAIQWYAHQSYWK